MTDWADEIAEDIVTWGGSPLRENIATALRKAKAKGMLESLALCRDSRYRDEILTRADKIERGEP